MRYLLLLSILLVGCSVKNVEVEKDISDRVKAANNAFTLAEADVFKEDKPNVPVDNVKPDPDPDKCACKGSGKIVHGDGHSTPCPFHAVELIIQQH